MKIFWDFETRSKINIWDCGAWAYSVHPSTEILCLAYAIENEPVQIIRKEEFEGLFGPPFDIKNTIFNSFNAFFENCIYNNILVKRYNWPRIPINQFKCSMAKALASAYPQSLANACKALNTPYQKSVTGHTLMLKMSKLNMKGDWNENPEDFEKLYQYCIDDVMAERSLDQMLPDLNPSEQTIWFLDELINTRGITIDREAVEKALAYINAYTVRLNQIVFEQSGAQLDGVTRRQAVLDWCRTQGVEINGYRKTDVEATLQQDLPESVRTVLETKLQLGKTSVAKYSALKDATTSDGRLRDTLIYHGATTGRWTGKLFQLHNLPTSSVTDTGAAIEALKKDSLEDFELFYPDVMGTLSSCIRGMIIASPGTNLFVGDWNAIEARIVMWLAGDEYGLKQYRENRDLYIDMAKRIYNQELISKKQRELGKAVILGAGFGMGKDKFALTCAARGAPVSIELAEKAINMYRETYSKVKGFWYGLDATAIETVRTKRSSQCGPIKWSMNGENLICTLPSGRNLTYPSASLEYTDTPWGDRKLTLHYMAVDTKNKWSKEKTFGGKICENVVQATARDILANTLLRLERKGYPIIFHVHDEVVAEVPERHGSLEEFNKLMCVLPEWAEGLPLKAECWKGKRYKK